MPDLIAQLQQAKLVGRGGAEFPVHLKWMAVQKAEAARKYVICNISEREPGVFKDFYILEHHCEKMFQGIRLAMETVGAKECFLNFNAAYYAKLRGKVDPLIADYQNKEVTIRVFEEEPSYIGGEETAIMNAIEGKRVEPRLKPPYPTAEGLYGLPTLVHNPETFYEIACVADGTYEGKRFYSVSGAVKHPGVYHLPQDMTINQVLSASDNLPEEDYFVQAGGGASGIIFNRAQSETEQARGSGSIVVHRVDEDPRALLLHWLTFYKDESCGKCTPCREGTYQLWKMVSESSEIPWEKMLPILEVLEKTSFCPLGKSVAVPVRSYARNVLGISLSLRGRARGDIISV